MPAWLEEGIQGLLTENAPHALAGPTPVAGFILAYPLEAIYLTAGGYRVQIAYHSSSAPINSKIELLKVPIGNSAVVKEPAPLAFDLPVIPSRGTGLYVYLVTGTWRDGSVSFFLVLDETPGVA